MDIDEDKPLEGVVKDIENKLEILEQKREELRDQIELKRAQIDKLDETLTQLRDLDDKLELQ